MVASNHNWVEIGLLCYPNAQQAALSGLTDLLSIANHEVSPDADHHPIRVSHWSVDNATMRPERGYDSHPERSGEPTVLLMPPSLVAPPGSDVANPFVDWLSRHHHTGGILASVCAGAFILAETGLLNGRRATTHWMYAERFRERFPGVHLDTDRLVIDDGEIVTAGGAMAWTDLGLKLLDRFLGPSVMMRTAQLLLVDPPGREQRYYSVFSPPLMHGDSAILAVQHWLQETEPRAINVSEMARVAGLNERTFQRRLIRATGMTPSDYWQRLRVGKARELLQFTRMSVDSIAWEVGYLDPGAFRKVFHRVVGLTPGEYRKDSGRTSGINGFACTAGSGGPCWT